MLLATLRPLAAAALTGGLTIKRNDWRNGFGALGDVFLILGRFNLAPIAEQPQ